MHSTWYKHTHKFGIEFPKTVEDTLELDKQNENTLWADAIAKEMKNVWVAFEPIEYDAQPPNGYQFVECHMTVDMKMKGFSQKARLVAGEYFTDVPVLVMYASVISRETVQIVQTIVI